MECVSGRVYLLSASVNTRVRKPLDDKYLGVNCLQGRRVGLWQTITWMAKCTGKPVLDGTVWRDRQV